ncbi:MAG: peptidoglycan D,D-transpeptidase FtsI family protein [Nitrospiria bacterium]
MWQASQVSQVSNDLYRPSRVYIGFACLMVGFVLVSVRLVFVQWFQHEEWLGRARQGQELSVKVEAERGTIYDRHGNVLAMSVERPSIYAIPKDIEDPVALSRRLAPILGVPQKGLIRRLRSKENFVWLRRKLTNEKRLEVEKLKLKGIGFLRESKRVYPKGPLFGHLLGFAGLDNQGLEGIERKYDHTLRGRNGELILERDGMKKSIFRKDLEFLMPTPGTNLYLTVDEMIQYISERELDRIVEETDAEGGTVIVMDPWSGEILSMAVRPEFDPNRVKTAHPAQWRNRAITDFYEPGSTFKIVTAAAALEERLIGPDDLIDCEEGAYAVKGTIIHDHDAIGTIPFRQVIAKSSNIGTIKVAEILGTDRLERYVHAFGFGSRLGVDLLGESPGLLRGRKKWSGRSLASIAIGQEVGVTPLQMVTATSVLANGGWLMSPRIVREIKGAGRHQRRPSPTIGRVVSEETTEKMVQILKGVVSTAGTASRAAIPGYSVAGKTGTAQKIDPATGRYAKDKFVSSFVGFVPADNPVISILVMVDEPKGHAWGGEVAAPVFASISKDVLHYLKVPPQSGAPETIQPVPELDFRKKTLKRVAAQDAKAVHASVMIGPAP